MTPMGEAREYAAGGLRALAPDVPSFGFATALSINATSIWGGIYPCLSPAYQTELVTIEFYICQILGIALSFLGWMISAWLRPSISLRNGVFLIAAALAGGPLLMIDAMYVETLALPFIMVAALITGFGTAGFFVRWQRSFAAMNAVQGNLALIKGTMGSAVMYLCLCLIPQALTAFMLPLVIVPLAALCLWLTERTIRMDQPMFEDIPRNHASVYRNALRQSLPPALGVGALGFCSGAIRFIAITHQELLSTINILSMVTLLAVVAVFYVLWTHRTARISLTSVYLVLFPIVAVFLVAMPFVGAGLTDIGFGAANACFMLACMFMMTHCGQLSRDNGISPILIYGFYGVFAYGPQIFGYLIGYASGIESHWGVEQFSLVSLSALFVLLMAAILGLRGSARNGWDTSLEIMQLTVQMPSQRKRVQTDNTAESTPTTPAAPSVSPAASAVPDPLTERCRQVSCEYGLSSRETEVMELIARGYTGPAIAEMLFISENTMRTHNKRIYAKLDIHKKQELLQLINAR